MTTRNFDALFAPKAIALLGASARPGSVGQVVARNLTGAGFAGPVMMVNPNGGLIEGVTAFRAVAELPETPVLAVIATPAATVPGLIGELGARGCRAAVVISAGFEGSRGAQLRQAMLDSARPHLLRIVGPNCLGVLSPKSGLNASFAGSAPPAGRLALVAQSGAVAAAAMDWAPAHGVGFSRIVSVGDCADVDVADLLDWLALDTETAAILLYLEGVADARKFMSAARLAARAKPVAVLKAGRSAAGAQAALTHTGALAGAYAVYEAAFRRAGLLQVEDLGGLLRAGATLGGGLTSAGRRLAILTNGGGAGVLAVDALETLGEGPTELAAATLATLDKIAPANWSRRNPVDILGDAHPEVYGGALQALLEAPEVDAVLVLNCPVAVADSTAAAQAVIEAAAGRGRKPVLTAWLGGESMAQARRRFAAAGLPSYDTPEDAAQAFADLMRASRGHDLLAHVPALPEPPIDAAAARDVVAQARAAGRAVLTDPETRRLLSAYGVPVVPSVVAATPKDAGAAAASLGGAVALKILSRDISHKSDLGGVRLGLEGAGPVEAAAADMLARIGKAAPKAVIEGFVVEPMVERRHAEELLAGLVQDPTFGPVVMVGQGGVAVQVLADRALGLPPLNAELARDMIGQTRVSRLLAGYRDRPPADLDALCAVLISLGRLAADLPEVAELDINPLLCDAEGVLGVDARIRLMATGEAASRPAIAPYPADLTRQVTVAGERFTLRPIRPADAAQLAEMVDLSTPEDVHLRFCGGLRHLTGDLVARLTQIDYDRQMALVAEDPAGAILGVGRLAADPQGQTAEFALMVRSDRQRRGLGRLLLSAVLDHAASRGLDEVWGSVGRDNNRMLGLAKALGFRRRADADLSRVQVVKSLATAESN